MKAIAPNGLSITGTVERVPGEALIEQDSFKLVDGKLSYDHAGYTEIDWDNQTTQTAPNGEELFYDLSGNIWPASQITLVSDEDEADAA